MSKVEIFRAGTKTAGQICTVCQSAIVAGEEITYCPDCRLPFHLDCWQENGGCSQYGCRSAPGVAGKSSDEIPQGNVWGEEKACPACGSRIKARALKCRFCGATFDTSDFIAPERYARREYEGAEYGSARNKTIALFLVSASGCLSPVALIALAVLLVNERCFGIEYRRLPQELRILAWLGFALSALLVFVLLLLAVFDG